MMNRSIAGSMIARAASLTLLSAVLAAPVVGQDGWRGFVQDSWLGLDIRFESDSADGVPGADVLVIEEVVDDSPAEAAGVRAGDVLVEIDGDPASRDRLEELVRDLDPGDPVALALDRSGTRLSLVVQAEQMPDERRRRSVAVLVGPDGVGFDGGLRILMQDLDSLRAEIEVMNRDRLRTLRTELDSLVIDLDGLEELRIAFDSDSIAAIVEGIVLDEERVRELQEQLERSREVTRGQVRASLEVAERARVRVEQDRRTQEPNLVWGPDVPWVVGSGDATIIPWLRGGRVIAGAELADLNPPLADYFGVDEGVLVLDVVDRSPASAGGLRPGDVLIEVDGEEVDSVAETREIVSRHSFSRFWDRDGVENEEESLGVVIIREGQRMELELQE